MAEVELFGEKFALTEEISEFALMEFSELADEIDENNTIQAMAAIMRLLREAIDPDSWDAFKKAARKNKARVEQLMPVIFQVYEQETDHPTQRPSGSSAGPSDTVTSLSGDSASRVIARLVDKGRDDLAVMVEDAQEFLAG